MKRIVALTLAVLMVLSLVACGNGNSTSIESATNSTIKPDASSTSNPVEVKYKDRLVFGVTAVLTKQDPPSTNTEENSWVYETTHNTLVDCDWNTMTIVPELAKSWTISDDGKVYTFKLEEGVKFHNGTDFTAEDAIYSLEHAAANKYQANKLADIVEMKADDDYTLVITLKDVNSEFLYYLASGYMSIICKEAVDADPDNGFKIGTGAYIQTDYVPNDHVIVERNENYWGEMPKTKILEWRFVTEASARVIGLQTEEYAFINNVPAVEVAHVEEAKNCDLINLPSVQLVYLGINTLSKTNPALQNPKVREALNYATNHEDLVIAFTEGYGGVPNGVIPPSVYGYSDAVKAPTYDIEKAKSLLAEAGYPNGITLSLTTNAASFPGQFEVLQAMWAPAGIKLELDTDDPTIRLEHLRAKSYDLLATQWTFTGGINSDLYAVWGSTSGSNRSLMADPHVDGLLEKALRESDQTKVLQYYAELSQYLADFNGIIPLHIGAALYGVNKELEGAKIYANNRHEFTYAYMVEK